MAFVLDAAYNAALAYLADNGSQLDVTSDSGTPTDLTNSLGSTGLTSGDGNGDFTIQAGDVSGRKLTLAGQTISATGTGTATYWVLSDGAGTILAADTMDDKSVESGYDYEMPAIDIAEFRDAA